MILFSISPQCPYHSGRERLFDIGQRQNRLNCSTSTWKYWNIEKSFCAYRCFRISKLLLSCCFFLFSQMMFMCVQAWVRVWQTQTCWKLKPRLYEAGNPLEDITKIFNILINFKFLKMCTSVQLYFRALAFICGVVLYTWVCGLL